FRVAQSCWNQNPDSRPSFSELLPQLESFREISEFQDEKPYVVGVPLPSSQPDFDVSLESGNSEDAMMNGDSQSGPNLANSSGAVSLSQSGSQGTSKKNRNRPSLRSIRKEFTRPPPLVEDLPPHKGRPSSFYLHNSHPPSPHSPFSYSTDAFEMRSTPFGTSSQMRSPREPLSSTINSRISPGALITPNSRVGGFLHDARSNAPFYEEEDVSLSHSWAPSVAASLPSLEMANKRSTQMGMRENGSGLLMSVSSSTNALNGRRLPPSAPPPSQIGGVRKSSKSDNQPMESVV
ncbi:hypothetical protein PMAYCL1PPCAC_29166, partial [Pristionchus mayeri]